MGMMINRRRVCGGKSLPYDAEIEYLESIGRQYIDTNIPLHSQYVVELTAEAMRSGNWAFFSGCNGNSYNLGEYGLFWYHNNVDMLFPMSNESSKTVKFGSINIQQKYNIKLDYGIVYIDDVLSKNVRSSMYGDYICQRSCYLFASHRSNSTWYSYLRVYSFKIIDENNNVLINLIPVRVGQVGYMYDKVTKQLFGNAGTGNFILGPDI